MKFFVHIPMPGIKAVIAGHFKMFFRYVLNKKFDKIHYGKRTLDIGIIFMPVIVKSNVFSIIRINAF